MEAAADEAVRNLPALIDNDAIVDVIVKDDELLLTLATRVKRHISESDEERKLTDDEADQIAREWSAWEESSDD